MILSFFDTPLDYSENIRRISETLNLQKDEIINYTSKLINNSERIWIGEGNNACQYPENVLIEKSNNYIEKKYNFRDFIIDGNNIDFLKKRFYLPIETVLMANTMCYTDCVYCYADRSSKFDLKIPFERLCEIIDEAKQLKFRKFDISGGEFFLYKNWEKLIEKLVSSGFNPTIPTKIPLSSDVIRKIKEKGLEEIQISLDSTNADNLLKILKVSSNYWKKMDVTFKELESNGMKFRVNTIITSFNCDFEEINNLIKYLSQYEYFNEIRIGRVGTSIYKSNEQNKILVPNKANVEILMNKLKDKYINNKKVIISGVQPTEDKYHLTEDAFFKKAFCTGNLHAFFILPDGKVTICEELYWHPKFIIGDLMKQSIMEIWNSDKALELYYLKQNELSTNSVCSKCKYLDYCHQSGGKCWRDILKVYGKENWDYPDPRCPYSPEPINEVHIS